MIPFPNKKYKVIYADPPWYFKSYSKKGEGRNATQHYDCMKIENIKNLPVKDISENDSTLLMWVTDPFLKMSFEVIESWGFKYKTVGFVWAKTNKDRIKNYYFKGPGYWTRANPEICILATKGKPKRVGANVDRLVVAERREHSRKPDRVRNDIVELCGDLPRIELFARQKFDGWDCWGNEV